MVCRPYLPESRIEAVISKLDKLESLSDINALAELLVMD